MKGNHCFAMLLGLCLIVEAASDARADCGYYKRLWFGQKGHIVKITAISGFASCDAEGPMAIRDDALMDHIQDACWVFLLADHGGENVPQLEALD